MRSPLHRQEDHERQWTRRLRLVDAYRRGDPVDTIVERYGVCRGTVLTTARKFNLPKRPKSRITQEERDSAMLAYERGAPVADIASEFGVSQAWVSTEARKRGINRRTFSTAKESE